MNDLPSSLEEKGKDVEQHWLFVHELRKILDELKSDDWLTPNTVGNLNVGRGSNPQVATINLYSNEIVWWGKEKDKLGGEDGIPNV